MTRRIYVYPDEAAQLLGITERTVWQMISDGRLPSSINTKGDTRLKMSDIKMFALGPHRRVTPSPEAQITHGLYAYSKYKCRCEVCVKARSDYIKNRRATNAANQGEMILTHGLRYTYTEYGCRCDRCKAANALYAAQRRAVRKEMADGVDFSKL